MKTDDDTFLNVPLLLSILQREYDNPAIFGDVRKSSPVVRKPDDKWFAKFEEFQDDQYPTYVAGIFFALHQNVVEPIARAAVSLQFFHLEDVFLTGLAAQVANISHVMLDGVDIEGQRWQSPCSKRKFLAIHRANGERMMKLWNDACEVHSVPCRVASVGGAVTKVAAV